MTIAVADQLTEQVVYKYWQEKADEMGLDRSATIRDQHFHDLEIDTITRFLRPQDEVIDIGCGNGLTTLRYASHVQRIVGTDFSPGMVDAAGTRLLETPAIEPEKVSFRVANALDLPFDNDSFTRAVMQRCLINIPDRGQQVEAAKEAGRVLRSGELLLLAEVTQQGHDRVNKYRQMFGLSKLKVHWHNTYIDEDSFLKAITPTFELVETVRFGMYGFISKVLHPLLVEPNEPTFDAKINEVAATIARQIPDFDGCSHQVLFVLKKR